MFSSFIKEGIKFEIKRIALAISDYKIKLWDKHTHAFEWLSENNIDTYVLWRTIKSIK